MKIARAADRIATILDLFSLDQQRAILGLVTVGRFPESGGSRTTADLWRSGDLRYKQDGRRLELMKDHALRQAIKDRDGGHCRYCGIQVSWSDRRSPIGATYDHVDPMGDNTMDNLVIACRSCNFSKGSRTPEQAGIKLRDLTPDLTPGVSSGVNSDLLLDRSVAASKYLPNGSTNGSNHHRPFREAAIQILDMLNVSAGRSFRKVDTNLRIIEARMASGATPSNCKGVVARKVREWKNDPKMSKFLRPETLFSAAHFESYLGEREPDNGA